MTLPRPSALPSAPPCSPGLVPAELGSPELFSPEPFSSQVRDHFSRRAASYDHQARLQQGVAWRLGRLCRDLPLPPGPSADLGAGSGLLSRALLAHRPDLQVQPPRQLDLCPELLARNPLAASARPWDLNGGLPPELDGAALLGSSFALHWLDDPAAQLRHWVGRLAPGGWLVLVVPLAGSFASWQAAAAAAAVPCTALPLPAGPTLVNAACSAGLEPHHCRQLRFSQAPCDGLASLRWLRQLGASASRQPPLGGGQLRRLLAHWPASPLQWQLLLLIGQKRRQARGS